MAEYKSFHYQMHQVPEPIKPHYLQAPKALKFSELYSPRNDMTITMGKHERSFWRTRDRIEFEIYENRKNEVVFITCHNLDNQEVYRTIFLHADVLYFEVEAKAREDGSRERILRKRDKQFYSDELLYKAVCDYILTRLNITTELVMWPDFVVPEPVDYANLPTKPSTPNPHDLELHELTFTPVEPAGPLEKMVTFSKVFSDKYLYLEINKPAGLNLEGIPFVKTEAGPLVAIPVMVPSPVKPAPVSAPEPAVAVAVGVAIPAPVDTTSDVPPATNGKKVTPKSSKGVTALPILSSGLKSGTATGTATPAAGSLPSTARMDIPLLVIPGSGSNNATPHSTPSAAAHKTASASPSAMSHALSGSGSANTTPMNAKKVTPSGKSAPLARGRSTVLVKHNNTPVSGGKSASATNLGANATGTAPSTAGAAGMVGSASTAAVAGAGGSGLVLPPITTASPRLSETKVTGTPANTPAHVNTTAKTTSASSTTTPSASATTAAVGASDTTATTTTPTANTTANTTAEKKKANPSPMNARHSIIGMKSNTKVAST